jgi:hypothetical protein
MSDQLDDIEQQARIEKLYAELESLRNDRRKTTVEIERMQAEADLVRIDREKRRQDIRTSPWLVGASLLGGAAAFFTAGAALFSLLLRGTH